MYKIKLRNNKLFECSENETINLNLKYVPVLSREKNNLSGNSGYVQDMVLKNKINLEDSQVYACGSTKMIKSSKEILVKNKLNENNFFSDAFVETN
tara:strand:+ start:3326 stop:3613 length:288 start_codon:yes stop_codon:yes gene_type:complete